MPDTPPTGEALEQADQRPAELLERVDLAPTIGVIDQQLEGLADEEGRDPSIAHRFTALANYAKRLAEAGLDRGRAVNRLAKVDADLDRLLLEATTAGLTWPQAYEALATYGEAVFGLPTLDQLYRRARGGSANG